MLPSWRRRAASEETRARTTSPRPPWPRGSSTVRSVPSWLDDATRRRWHGAAGKRSRDLDLRPGRRAAGPARRPSAARARCPSTRASTQARSAAPLSGLTRALEVLRGLPQEVVDEQRDVLAALGERRDGQLDHAQPVVEILAEAAGAHRRFEILVGRGDDAGRRRESALLPPTRSNSRSCSARRNLACVSSGMSPTSSRNSVPPSAASNLPSRRATAPVKAPLLVAEELALDQLAAERRAVHLHERLGAARAAVVERVGHQLLAGAAGAAHQHGDVGVGDLLDGRRRRAASTALRPTICSKA